MTKKGMHTHFLKHYLLSLSRKQNLQIIKDLQINNL